MHSNYPPEYTRGWVEFYYERFFVNENVLIPRLETESLVREAIRHTRTHTPDILIDIGTGSGIIPLSIVHSVPIKKVFACDISKESLSVAQRNAQEQRKKIAFLESNLLSVFLEKKETLEQNQDICIVTNLPYIRQEDWDNMSDDTRHEPKLALFGGEHTGFELYEELFSQIELFIEIYNPKHLIILAEMGEDQNDIATKVLTSHGWEFSFFADLRGIHRFMRIQIR